MFVNYTSVRVRYAETDQMGVVYYGNYPQFFEVGRVEAMRELNMSYREMEEKGTMLPVLELNVTYIRPARYDDLLRIKTELRELPGTRITFYHEVYNEKEELLTRGSVQLVFIDKETRRPCRAPEYFMKKIAPFFDQ